MQKFEPLNEGCFYHIYNCGVNKCNLFSNHGNYEWFLELYHKYISPVADTYAWVLMPNHFHLLVKVKENVVYKYSNTDRSYDAVRLEEHKWETIESLGNEVEQVGVKKPQAHLHFSHLFNAYSKCFNNFNHRHGSLFERPFKRKLIQKEEYLKKVILYIHNNPVHHGFCEHAMDYPWSSYLTCVSVKPTKLHREQVIGWFDNHANFTYMHDNIVEVEKIDNWLADD